MSKRLQTLGEFDKNQRKKRRKVKTPTLNGIACPECSEELFDSDQELLMSDVPKRRIHCESCGYAGLRAA